MGFRTKATKNKEEYKGFLKLFLQRNNFALVVCLCLVAFAAVLLPADPAGAVFFQYSKGSTQRFNTDSGTVLRNEGKSSPLQDTPGTFGVSYFPEKPSKPIATDTRYGVPAGSSAPRVMAIYGDTMAVIGGPTSPNDTILIAGTSLFDTVYLSTDSGGTNDTMTYILSVTNYGNTPDMIGLIVDTAWVRGATTDTTLLRFQYQFFNRNGAALTGVLSTAHQETGLIAVNADTASETAILRIYTNGTVNADTVRVAVRAFANNGTGRVPGTTREVAPYVGFNGVKYGGSGNAATYIEVSVGGALLRVAKTDTVFSPLALDLDGNGAATDTQVYVPGAMMVYTIWFDNDGIDATDTIVVEDWIDTRHLRFDSAGLGQFIGVSQIAAAETFVNSRYGNIFLDSGMPTVDTANYNVTIQYASGGDSFSALTAATPLESVSRIRWIVGRLVPGTRSVAGASNGDNLEDIDAPPVAPKSSGDADMGYVRFAVVIR